MAEYDKNLLDAPYHNVTVLGKMTALELNYDSASTDSGIELGSQQPQHLQQQNHHEQSFNDPKQAQNHQALHLSLSHHHDYLFALPEKINTINYSIENSNKKGRIRRDCCSRLVRRCKGSIHLAFLSHFCFVVGCLFYIKLSLVNKAWIQYTMVDNDLPSEILVTDDDIVWTIWASENQGEYREPLTFLHSTRLTYDKEYTIWCTLGASCFALVGALDWARYGDKLNMVMILAGLAGVLSGNSKSSRTAAVWDVISVHLFFLESITLLKRVHHYPAQDSVVNANESILSNHYLESSCVTSKQKKKIEYVADHYLESSGSSGSRELNGICSSGMDGGILDATTYIDENDDDFPCFRVGDLFFFLGSMLDVAGSYIRLAGMVGIWFAYTDLVSCFLWLGCALLAISQEVYYLQKQVAIFIQNGKEYDSACFHCY